jgi:hypothetical protein
MEKIMYKGCKIEVYQSDGHDSPRDWDNLGTMIHWHPNYILGEKRYNRRDFNSPMGSLQEELGKDLKTAIILPLYLYDHSGITMNTTGFSCPWDSGQVGWIYVTRKKLREEKLNKKTNEEIKDILRGEVETFDHYISGEVYGFCCTDPETGDTIDSCCGYYGDPEQSGLMEEARSSIDRYVDEKAIEDQKIIESLQPTKIV